MAEDRLLMYAIIGFFAGLYFFFRSFSLLKEKKLIENTPTSKIRSLAIGFSEIYGEAVSQKDKVLKSPFSKSDCVYYRYSIEEYRSSKNGGHWVSKDSGEIMDYFYLKDSTGMVLVDPRKAKIEIPDDYSVESGVGRDPPKETIAFLKTKGMRYEGLFGFNKRMRYREAYIAPKDKLYVIGTCGKNPFVQSSPKNEDTLMMQKGSSFYYLSDKPEKDVVSSFGLWVKLGMIGAPVLTVVCLIIILAYAGAF
jgi:hypothetical protein